MRTLRLFSALSAVILFSHCAQIVMPNGGAKDITPPKVTKYMPDSAATNFKGKEINIVFNEYIQLKDVNNQLIVSPLLDEQPEIKLVKNHILNIEFKKPLKENTTYTMNFGNSIADYNEGNEIDNFQYVFSTGPFIDSLSLSGKVQYAFDHKSEKGIMVMLYDASTYTDSTPYKTQPSYFSKTKPDGTYKINNIRAGKYKVFALRDENKNYKYDESEVIGFVENEIEINKSLNLDVELFKEVPKKLKLLSARAVDYGHIVLAFNKTLDNPIVKALNVSKIPIEVIEISKNRDSINYWFEGVTSDSLKLQLSENTTNFDTCEIRLITKEQNNKLNKGEKLKLNGISNVVSGGKMDLNKNLSVLFSHPLLHGDWKTKGISLRSDTVNLLNDKIESLLRNRRLELIFLDPKDWSKNITTPILHPWKENTSYKLFIPPGAFVDIFGSKNDTIKIDFKTQDEKFYGNIKLKLNVSGGNYVLQFLDAKENVVKEETVSETKTFKYDYLQPGAYKLKLILDKNKDGKWSTGNYLEKTQAEKVIYYDKPITIRSNWDLELEWKINQ